MIKLIIQLITVLIPVLNKQTKQAEIIPFPKKKEEPEEDLVSFVDYITSSGLYPERLQSEELTEEKIQNAYKLLAKINPFLKELGVKKVKVSSGFRDLAANKKAGGAKKSLHMDCLAIDFSDKDGNLKNIILNKLELAKKYEIYIENPSWTVGWIHCQIVAPSSKKRVFIPSTAKATDPKAWNGIYDKELDG